MPRRPPASREPEEVNSSPSNHKDWITADVNTDERQLMDDPFQDEDDDDGGADTYRVSQWEDIEDFELDQLNMDAPGSSKRRTLQNDLSDLPLGVLRRAQRMLQHAAVDSSAESDNSTSDGGTEASDKSDILEEPNTKKRETTKSAKPRKEIEKRSSKHAPMELTSKKPVSRKRMVVEVKTQQPRDPRFLPLAGQFDTQKFRESYGFLTDVHKSERVTLRENLKRARKLLSSSPRDLYAEREMEVKRLELALKRAESQVNKDRQERLEENALKRARVEEEEKRKAGKKAWYLKKSSQRELLLKARFEALATEGGKRAVKKAIEKKQSKVGQKEKKMRPYPDGGGLKRRASLDGCDRKRRKRQTLG